MKCHMPLCAKSRVGDGDSRRKMTCVEEHMNPEDGVLSCFGEPVDSFMMPRAVQLPVNSFMMPTAAFMSMHRRKGGT